MTSLHPTLFLQRLALLALSALLAACARAPQATDAWGVYHAAIADAAVAAPAKVLPLRPLPPGDTVEMVSWGRQPARALRRRALPLHRERRPPMAHAGR